MEIVRKHRARCIALVAAVLLSAGVLSLVLLVAGNAYQWMATAGVDRLPADSNIDVKRRLLVVSLLAVLAFSVSYTVHCGGKLRIVFAMLLVPIVPATLMTSIGLSHNAMGEFYTTNNLEATAQPTVDVGYVLLHFAVWYVAVLLGIIVLELALRGVRVVVGYRR